jgi:hypothetical protein
LGTRVNSSNSHCIILKWSANKERALYCIWIYMLNILQQMNFKTQNYDSHFTMVHNYFTILRH